MKFLRNITFIFLASTILFCSQGGTALADENPEIYLYLSPDVSTIYQGENISFIGDFEEILDTSVVVKYYLVDEDHSDTKSYLGRFDLDKGSSGFSAGLISEWSQGNYWSPGSYHFLVRIDGEDVATTDTFKVLRKSSAPDVKIVSATIDFESVPFDQRRGEYDYKILLRSESNTDFAGVFESGELKCSKNITMFWKTESFICTSRGIDIAANETFAFNSKDIEGRVYFTFTPMLKNTYGVLLDSEEVREKFSKNDTSFGVDSSTKQTQKNLSSQEKLDLVGSIFGRNSEIYQLIQLMIVLDII